MGWDRIRWVGMVWDRMAWEGGWDGMREREGKIGAGNECAADAVRREQDIKFIPATRI